jgi:bacteriorhodopsin
MSNCIESATDWRQFIHLICEQESFIVVIIALILELVDSWIRNQYYLKACVFYSCISIVVQ